MAKLSRLIDYGLIKCMSLLPISRNMIVLHSLPDYSDNAWAFYQYLIDRGYNRKYRIIWLVEKPEKYKPEENVRFVCGESKWVLFRRDYYLARAKFVVHTHRTPIGRWRKDQVFINTTHSASQLKAAGGELQKTAWRSAPTYRLRCGEDGLRKMMKTTGKPESHFLVIGMPRLDLLYRHRDCVSELYPGHKYAKVVIVMETFRQNRNFIDSSFVNTYGMNLIRSEAEQRRLDDWLVANNVLMIIKPHPMQDLSCVRMESLTNIRFLAPLELCDRDIQLYQLLENCDALLTDYSSIYYDFLLLNRPIGFMISDMDAYSRGFVIDDPVAEMPGRKLERFDDLLGFLEDLKQGKDDHQAERKALTDKVFKYQDDNNCKRLMDFIEKYPPQSGR